MKMYENRREGVTARKHDLCDCTMREERWEEADVVLISLVSVQAYRHNLDELDKYKINDGFA